MAISSYSATPSSNTAISGINIGEGCAPSGINDAIRQLMADIKTDAIYASGGYACYTVQAGTQQAYFGSTGANPSQVYIDNAAGGQNSLLGFSDAGVAKWASFKNAVNQYVVAYDYTNSKQFITATIGGSLALGAAQGLSIANAGAITNTTAETTGTGITLTSDTITTGSGVRVIANNLTSGTGIVVNSTSTAGLGGGVSFLINAGRSGVNANASHTAYGVYSAISNTGATSTNVAGYFSAVGATNNFALSVPSNSGVAVIGGGSIYNDGAIGTPQLQAVAVTGSRAGMSIAVSSGSASTTMIGFVNSNGLVGGIATNGTTTSYVTTSDYRIKEDWRPLKKTAMDTLDSIPIYSLTYKSNPEQRLIGFLAHEVQEVMPEAVTGEKDAIDEDGNPILQMVDYSKIVPLLMAAVQEVNAENKALKDVLKSALERISTLEARLGVKE
jgi:hypothetical protein